MRQASDSEELAATLVDAAVGFRGRRGISSRIDGESARGERIRGVPEQTSDRFRGDSDLARIRGGARAERWRLAIR